MSTRWPRTIVHADMDAFYAAVEQLDEPKLRGLPVLVGPSSGRGVVLTASYEARPYRVGSAMPMAEARRRCPDAIVVPPRFERYRELSRTIMNTFAEFSPAVEALSLDEAFLDMSGAEHFFGAPEQLGATLKAAVHDATGGLTVSVGISGTKYVAKVASGFAKPDGLTIVPQNEAQAWLAVLPVASLWGAGKVTQAKLGAAGYATIGDIARADARVLERQFGKAGAQFFRLARADDPREVVADREAKSVSSERTFETDIGERAEIEFQIRKAADQVGRRLRREGLTAAGVRLKLKTNRFEILTRQRMLPAPTQSSELIFVTAAHALPPLLPRGPFRLVGVGTFRLAPAPQDSAAEQIDFLDAAGGTRNARLEQALDAVEAKYGAGAISRAGSLVRTRDLGIAAPIKPGEGPE